MSSDLSRYVLPSKEDITLLPVFQNLGLEHIHVIHNREQCHAIENELKTAAILGFDSESKPTFVKGEVQTGPHLIQLASFENAYLFQVNVDTLEFLKPIFASRDQIKVGFGLKNDAHLFRKKGIELNHVIELSKCFTAFGFKNPMGVKNAIALLFQQNFPKNRKISTSNWNNKKLSSAQIDYAAADAYACIIVFEELHRLGQLPQHIPNTSLKLRIRPNKSQN